MTIRPIAAIAAASFLAFAASAPAQNLNPRFCALKSAGTYGFQCTGSTSLAPGAPAEPVTFIGTVVGRDDGFYEGGGTINSSQGSNRSHVAGYAIFSDNCFGRVTYTTNEIILPDGTKIALPPLVIDFVSVNDFNEILGTPVAPGSTGDAVPRLACRLVRI